MLCHPLEFSWRVKQFLDNRRIINGLANPVTYTLSPPTTLLVELFPVPLLLRTKRNHRIISMPFSIIIVNKFNKRIYQILVER